MHAILRKFTALPPLSPCSSGPPQVVPGRQLAYNQPCNTRIPVGTRVIAKYKDDDPKNTTISGSFYVGIVAEVSCWWLDGCLK